MSKFTGRIAVAILALSSMSTTQSAAAGDNGHPGLNAIGRYLGVGYSHSGYQVAPGRFNVVRQLHPASNYGSSHLLAPYHQATYPQPLGFPPTQTASPSGMPKIEVLQAPGADPKPVGPPPNWLEPYLNERAEKPESEPLPVIIETESPSVELSPSDSDADELLFDSASNAGVPARTVNRYR